MSSSNANWVLLEQIVGEPIIRLVAGRLGFTNWTDIVTLTDGERVVVQRAR